MPRAAPPGQACSASAPEMGLLTEARNLVRQRYAKGRTLSARYVRERAPAPRPADASPSSSPSACARPCGLFWRDGNAPPSASLASAMMPPARSCCFGSFARVQAYVFFACASNCERSAPRLPPEPALRLRPPASRRRFRGLLVRESSGVRRPFRGPAPRIAQGGPLLSSVVRPCSSRLA